ncbi:MAG: prenyltransferase/squalene oxidase repeat-containing protein [Bryobacteraceae bacterium]
MERKNTATLIWWETVGWHEGLTVVRGVVLFALISAAGLRASPEDRALAYLAKEVPAWRRENGCFSCHNNGDAARALYLAVRLGRRVDPAALHETTAWLRRPSQWENNRGDPRFSDKELARLQFAAGLAAARDAGAVVAKQALEEAAAAVSLLQQRDGSWRVQGDEAAGSPVTWGASVATAMAREVLHGADAVKYRPSTQRADSWLRRLPLRMTADAAAVLIALPEREDEGVAFLRSAQSSDGGWGPAAHSPAEAFDTALALIGLSRTGTRHDALKTGGRAWLIRNQLESGGWRETTRPSGGASYAQHVSTTAWATIALLLTTPP